MGTIKSFKKFIEESLWTDIQYRSAGNTKRKEDDVNRFELNEFYEYIKDQYKTKVEYIDLESMGDENGDVLGVGITENVILFYKPKRGHILLSWSRKKIPMPFFDELTDKFKIENPNAMRRIITEKDGSCTNQTFIDVIEFFLDHKQILLNESLWTDIQCRSAGDMVRKEDEMTEKDKEDLDKLITLYGNEVVYGRGMGSEACNLDDFCDYIETDNEIKDLNKSKVLKYVKDNWEDEVCDGVAGAIEQAELEYHQDMNESLWTDIQRRSAGDTVRKEDDVNLMDKYTLYDYIMSTYGDMCISVNNLDEYILVKIVRGYELSLHYKNNKIDEILSDGFDFGDSSKFDTKFKIVKEEKALYKIFNLDGTVTNKTALDFIEFYYKNVIGDKEFDLLKKLIKEFVNSSDEYSLDSFCDYIKTKKNLTVDKIMGRLIYFIKNNEDFYSDEINKVTKDINESIWTDIQSRSAGDTIRKEDITEEDKREIDYIFNGFAYLIVYTDYEPTIDDFIKMMKEAYPDKDNSKYIAWVRSNWDKKYKDELDEKIQHNKKDVDKRIDKYLNNFVGQIVYCEKYNVSLSDIKKFSDEILKYCGMSKEMRFVGKIKVDESWFDIFKKYVDENWNDVKKRINDFIVEENQKIAKTGFKKTPGKKICDILDEWWNSLGDEKDDIAWDEFGERAEEKYYERHNPKYNEYTGEDFDADEEWSDASWIESVEIYMKYNKKTNESLWADIQSRSAGDTVRKEDEILTPDDLLMLRETAKMFRNVLKRSANEPWSGTCDDFIKFINLRKKEHFWNDTPDEVYDKVIKFVKDNWGDCIDIQDFMDKYLSDIWVNECDGIPGGLTPANVGGMGAAYFPGPNGEPGSGDLPSPTGIVYKQVAPFDTFIKMRKPKKNKKKKFRKEDEPCVHSPNAKVYDYVDDFRDYVDRTYNNIDRRK